MGNSLLDQLQKAGLVTEKQAKKAKSENRRIEKQGTGGDAGGKTSAHELMARKAERDRQLNLEKTKEAERKALAAQIKQLVEANRLPADGDVPYNFVHGNKVKTLHMSRDMHEQIVQGRLTIVALGQRYEVVPAAVAEKIAARDEACVVVRPGPDTAAEGDDPYAAYKVPDDLIW
ncbi:MAG TPA: DUF2058 domain-containing protein [Methylococcaceae bacterium]|nr:DUF2058 domain-containing protein [Methylococcaceae bacterium]